jgi:hypothetical protein
MPSSTVWRSTLKSKEIIIRTTLAHRSIAAAAAAVTLAILSAVTAVAEHEKEQAAFLAAQIKPQTLATTTAETQAR